MPRKSPLNERETQSAVIDVLRIGGSLGDACSAVGVCRRSLSQARKRHPEFDRDIRDAIEEARRASTRTVAEAEARSRIIDHHLTDQRAKSVRAVIEPEVLRADDGIPTENELVRWCWRSAKDPNEHPGVRAKCLHIVAGCTVVPAVFERRLQAESAARTGESSGGSRVVVVDLPRKSAGPASDDVVDAEVVG